MLLSMTDVGWFDAWQIWWQGRSTLGYELWGVPMIWWGRIGKSLAFVSGLTVVLDLIGPERIREFGRGFRDADPEARFPVWLNLALAAAALVPIGLGGYWAASDPGSFVDRAAVMMAVVTLVFLPIGLLTHLVRASARILEHRAMERVVRVGALVGLAVGFQFDLLAS